MTIIIPPEYLRKNLKGEAIVMLLDLPGFSSANLPAWLDRSGKESYPTHEIIDFYVTQNVHV